MRRYAILLGGGSASLSCKRTTALPARRTLPMASGMARQCTVPCTGTVVERRREQRQQTQGQEILHCTYLETGESCGDSAHPANTEYSTHPAVGSPACILGTFLTHLFSFSSPAYTLRMQYLPSAKIGSRQVGPRSKSNTPFVEKASLHSHRCSLPKKPKG